MNRIRLLAPPQTPPRRRGATLLFSIFLLVSIRGYSQSPSVSTPSGALFGGQDISSMVDPSTGNFHYNAQLLTIPGPEGDYPINLSYQSGIKVDQAASWVGLGWNLESNSITRSVSQIPDDYKGAIKKISMKDPGGYEVVPNPSRLELMILKLNRDMAKAAHNASRTGQLNFNDVVDIAIAYYQLSQSANVPSIVGTGGLSLLTTLPYLTAVPEVTGRNSMSGLPWHWTFWQYETADKLLLWDINREVHTRWFYTVKSLESEYGLLYNTWLPLIYSSANSPHFNPAFTDGSEQEYLVFNRIAPKNEDTSFDEWNATSDFFQYGGGGLVSNNTNPIYWAPDLYMVQALNLTGRIKPYRFDNASVAASLSPNEFYDDKIALVKHRVSENDLISKVQFGWEGDHSNHFGYHLEQYDNDFSLKHTRKKFHDNLMGIDLYAPWFLPPSRALATNAPAREGYDGSSDLVRGVSVKWYTNEEINDEPLNIPNLVLPEGGEIRPDSLFPAEGIGAIVITNPSGYTYHFTLPEYTVAESTILHVGSLRGVDSITVPYAHKWHLTSITGPDFRDSGTIRGQIDPGDEGYFVKFHYGKFTDKFNTQYPIDGSMVLRDSAWVRHWSTRQVYYLNKISTRSHSALFIKSVRRDNKSADLGTSSYTDDVVIRSLQLDQIVLLTNKDLDYLESVFHFGSIPNPESWYYRNENADAVYTAWDIEATPQIEEYLTANSLRTIVFGQSPTLYRGFPTTNSRGYWGRSGLGGVTEFGAGRGEELGSYSFLYNEALDITYAKDNHDAWGHWREAGSYKVSDDSKGDEWALTKIRTPGGESISIEYGRDEYARVSGKTLEESRKGGDTRVEKITWTDQHTVIVDTYDYRKIENGISSGVASQEPHLLDSAIEFKKYFGYPSSSVVYEKVTRTRAAGDGSQLGRQVYEFHTCSDSTITIDTLHLSSSPVQPDTSRTVFPTVEIKHGYLLHEAAYLTTHRSELIGKPRQVSSYDKNNVLVSQVTYDYEPSAYGTIQQSLNLFDHSFRSSSAPRSKEGQRDRRITARFINSVTQEIPYTVKRVSSRDFSTNQLTEVVYDDHDFYTGQPLRMISTDGYGNSLASVSVPAYHHESYQTLGDQRGMEPSGKGGKNILSPISETYVYRLSDDEDPRPVSLVGASVQTFNLQNGVWLPQAVYGYNSQALDPNGTAGLIDSEDLFRFGASVQPDGWEKKGEVSRYDDHSKPLEMVNASGIKSSSKYSADQAFVVASASGLDYQEFAYCGAEMPLSGSGFSSGVNNNDGIRTADFKHTGKYGLRVGAGSTGFSYRLTPGLANDKELYRLSVWVHQTNAANVQLTILVGGTNRFFNFDPAGKPAINGWYLFEADVDMQAHVISASTEVLFIVRNVGTGAICIDDFRVAPVAAAITCFTYNKLGKQEYVLDKDHYFTRYVYDDFGRISSVWQETSDGVIKRSQYEYNHASSN